MKSIWKYQIYPGQHTLQMPDGAELLCAREQGDSIALWAIVDVRTAGVTEPRRIGVFATGKPLPDLPMRFLGTACLSGGTIIFHVFEVLGVEDGK